MMSYGGHTELRITVADTGTLMGTSTRPVDPSKAPEGESTTDLYAQQRQTGELWNGRLHWVRRGTWRTPSSR